MASLLTLLSNKIDYYREKKIIPYIFTLNDSPMLLKDLLKTNKMYQEGLKLEGNIPGFRMSTGKSYIVFIGLWHLFLIPSSIIFHALLAKIDCHLLIIMAVLFTSMFFATYALFKEYLIDHVAIKILRDAWSNHFPHFDYDLHAKEVAKIYAEAIEKEIPHKSLQLYIIDRLIQQ